MFVRVQFGLVTTLLGVFFLLDKARGDIITFGNPSTYQVYSVYQESAYSITSYRMEIGYDYVRPPSQPLQGGLDNVQAYSTDNFVLARLDGQPFTLSSWDLRTPNYFSDGSATGSLLLEGLTVGGTHVTQAFSYTQGFTTFAISSAFSNLQYVYVQDAYFAVDNLVVTAAPAPEPGSIALLVCGATMMCTGRRFWRRSDTIFP